MVFVKGVCSSKRLSWIRADNKTGCNTVVACYAAAVLVFGMVVASPAAPPAALACNVAHSACFTAARRDPLCAYSLQQDCTTVEIKENRGQDRRCTWRKRTAALSQWFFKRPLCALLYVGLLVCTTHAAGAPLPQVMDIQTRFWLSHRRTRVSPKDESVKLSTCHIEIGARAQIIYGELVAEKAVLAKAVASLNTVRRKGKANIHIMELPEDKYTED
ncbi:hypothetical protein C8R44DRAFT_740890 [Mycena epipterygia]|nr:hypothetical protein C8R44DRAFT_740890 [Mycena epipterygia]